MSRIETQNGYRILCGTILPAHKLGVGQKWLSTGAKVPVEIVEVTVHNGDVWVTYESPLQKRHSKMAFAFQCRYCLVVDDELQLIAEES